MTVKEIGYAILQLKDPAGWADFAENILGFKRAVRNGISGDEFLLMDDAPFRYLAVKGSEDKFMAAGWDAGSSEAYNALRDKLTAKGVGVDEGSESEAARRAVKEFFSASDPSGNVFEVYHGREPGSTFSPGLGIKAFVTEEMGLGHCVLPAPETDATHAFYKEMLGFGDSDDLSLPPFAEGMPDQRVIFMHADNPRHHSLGLYNFPNPAGVVHLMVEVGSIDEVGACLDRVKKAGFPLLADLGRHANDMMVSFYFFGPGGICFEVGYDGLQIDDWSKFTPTKSTNGDLWGHEYNIPGEA